MPLILGIAVTVAAAAAIWWDLHLGRRAIERERRDRRALARPTMLVLCHGTPSEAGSSKTPAASAQVDRVINGG